MRSLMPFAVLTLTVACPAVVVSAERPTLDQVTTRLFEQADSALLPVTRRIYSTHFDATRTRALGLEVAASLAAPDADREVPVVCVLQRADGTGITAELNLSLAFAAGQPDSSAADLLRRAPDLESWQPGEYTVECRSDGQLIAESRIEIALNPPDVAGTDIRIAAIRLFPVERTLPAMDDRRYPYTLVAAETNHIGVELEFTHAPLGQAMKIPVECHYFWPDGQTSPPINLSYEPQASWAGGYSAGAIGWDQPGNWLKGIYTVTCSIRGRSVIVERFDLT